MAETFSERVDVTDAGGTVRIELDATAGTLRILDGSGVEILHMSPSGVSVRDAGAREVLRFTSGSAALLLGADGNDGDLRVRDRDGRDAISLAGHGAVLRVGTTGNAGDLTVRDADNRQVLAFDSVHALLRVGAEGNEGDIIVRDGQGREVIHADGGSAALYVGASGNEGDIIVRDGQGREAVRIDAATAAIRAGVRGSAGDVLVRDAEDRVVFHMAGEHAALHVGSNGNEGDIIVRDGEGRDVFRFNGNRAALRVGAAGNEGDVICLDAAGNESIHLDGGSGDIILRNADMAEQFDVADLAAAAPGTVMVLGADGRLEPSAAAFDSRVVGVVAGAGRFRPGIVMDHRKEGDRVPVAMVGKVAVKVDAGWGPIVPGALLVSSPTPGHAMAARDRAAAAGAILGKALTGLDAGTGLVEMVVCLQ